MLPGVARLLDEHTYAPTHPQTTRLGGPPTDLQWEAEGGDQWQPVIVGLVVVGYSDLSGPDTGPKGGGAANDGQQPPKPPQPPQPKKKCSITDKLNAANKKAAKLFLRDMAVGEGAAFLVGCGIGAPAGAPFGGPIGVIGGCAGGGVAAAGAALPLVSFGSALDASIEAYSGAFSSECD